MSTSQALNSIIKKCGYSFEGDDRHDEKTLNINKQAFDPIDFLILMWLDYVHDYKNTDITKQSMPPSRQRGRKDKKFGGGIRVYLKGVLGLQDDAIDAIINKVQFDKSIFLSYTYAGLGGQNFAYIAQGTDPNLVLHWRINTSNIEDVTYNFVSDVMEARIKPSYASYIPGKRSIANLPFRQKVKVAVDADKSKLKYYVGKPAITPVVNLGNYFDAGAIFSPFIETTCDDDDRKGVLFQPNSLEFRITPPKQGMGMNFQGSIKPRLSSNKLVGVVNVANFSMHGISDILKKDYIISSRGSSGPIQKFFGDFSQILYNLTNTDQFFATFDRTTIATYLWCCMCFDKPIRLITEEPRNNIIVYFPDQSRNINRFRTFGLINNKFSKTRNLRRVQKLTEPNAASQPFQQSIRVSQLNSNDALTLFSYDNIDEVRNEYYKLNQKGRQDIHSGLIKALSNRNYSTKKKRILRQTISNVINNKSVVSKILNAAPDEYVEKLTNKLRAYLEENPGYKNKTRDILRNILNTPGRKRQRLN